MALTPQNQGAVSDDPESLMRKHMNKAMVGPAWNALIAALATGDKTNFDNARLAFDMKYVSTAVSFYLDRKGADRGLQRPDAVGMDDEDYRKLIIKTTAKKLTPQVMYQILEIFYGTDATRAFVASGVGETFNFTAGDDFTVLIDEKTPYRIIFQNNDFQDITKATAFEAAASITRQLRMARSKAFAINFVDPNTNTERVRIYSGSLGLRSSVRVTGGRAQNKLAFPSLLPTHAGLAGVQTGQNWAVSIPRPGIMRLTLAAASTTDLNQVHIGDYINIYGANFATVNKGSYPIVNVDVRYVTGTLTQFIEVENLNVSAQASVAIVATSDLLFFRPFKSTISGTRTVVVAQTSPNTTHVILPATTTAVRRHKTTGAYLHARPLQFPTSIKRYKSTLTIDFGSSHGLATGEKVFIDGVYPTHTLPAVTAGNGTTTTDYSRVSPWTNLAVLLGGAVHNAAISIISNSAWIVGGRQIVPGPVDNGPQNLNSKFAISAGAVQSDGSTQYTYAMTQGAAYPTVRENHVITNLTDQFNVGRFISTGGGDATHSALVSSYIYDPIGDAWSSAINMSVARFGHAQSVLQDGTVLVTGGINNSAVYQNTTDIFTASGTSAGAFAAGTAMNFVRAHHQQITLSNGKVLVIGGYKSSTVITATCELYDPGTVTWKRVGDMGMARAFHQAILLPGDRVLVIGGNGWNVSDTPITSNPPALATAEIWDVNTNRWSPLPIMATPRTKFLAVYMPTKNKVLVGGNGVKVEFFDTNLWTWSRAPRSDADLELAAGTLGGLMADGTVFSASGLRTDTSLSTAKAQLWAPESNTLGSGGVNGRLHKITVTSPTEFTISTHEFPDALINDAAVPTVLPATAVPDSSFPGPFIFDPATGVGISGTSTTTTQDLTKGQQYAALNVADASAFPDKGGFLSIAFGSKIAIQPLKFLGKVSGTQLLMDFSTRMPFTVPSGAVVTLLVSKTPFVVDNPEKVGAFYLTASSAGRVAASNMIDSISASGFTIDKTIQYPGDRGLGGEGLPGEGAQKLSDKVEVWAGDDVDAEVAQARVGV